MTLTLRAGWPSSVSKDPCSNPCKCYKNVLPKDKKEKNLVDHIMFETSYSTKKYDVSAVSKADQMVCL